MAKTTPTTPQTGSFDLNPDLVQGVSPPPGGGAGTETAIGVPPTYKPPGPVEVANVGGRPITGVRVGTGYGQQNLVKGQPSLYSDSDVYLLAGKDPKIVKQVQEQLVAVGLLDPHGYMPGIWDANSQKAFTSVLAQANVYGATWKDTLSVLVDNAPDITGEARGVQQVANRMDIQAAVSTPTGANVAQGMIGQNLPQGESNNFLEWYRDQEAQARDRYNKVDLTKGGTYEGAPSIDAAAQEYIKQNNLDQVIAYGTASRMLQFQQLLGAL